MSKIQSLTLVGSSSTRDFDKDGRGLHYHRFPCFICPQVATRFSLGETDVEEG